MGHFSTFPSSQRVCDSNGILNLVYVELNLEMHPEAKGGVDAA